ncbi:MAG: hypothetical protein JRI25_08280 [Deltaproteobacteria bacterium]|nr:hypothetical protein [Deltaproteobacteria bacterium]MBW2254578.1 hypothetical protein [Deltaproteobacteria bacterium]
MTDGVPIYEISLRDGLQNEPETLPSRYFGWWKGRREREARQARSA